MKIFDFKNNPFSNELKNYKYNKLFVYCTFYTLLMPTFTTIIGSLCYLIGIKRIMPWLSLNVFPVTIVFCFLMLIFCTKTLLYGSYTYKSIWDFLKKHFELLFLIAFAIWCFVISFFHDSFPTALLITNTNESVIQEGYIFFITYIVFFFVAMCVKSQELIDIMIKTFLINVGFICLLSFIDPLGNIFPSFYNQNTPWAACFINSNHYGYYFSMSIVATAVIGVTTNKKWIMWSCLGLYVALTIQLFLNDCLGAMIAIMISLILLPIVLSINKSKFEFKYLIPFGIFLVMSFIVSTFSEFYFSTYKSLFSEQLLGLAKDVDTVASDPTSAEAAKAGTTRWSLWMKAFKEIKENPITGNGDVFLRPHNEYIQYALVWGIPSTVLYLSALGILVVKSIRRIKNLNNTTLVCIFVVCSYCMSAFVGNTMPHVMPTFITFLAFAIRLVNATPLNNPKKIEETTLTNLKSSTTNDIS